MNIDKTAWDNLTLPEQAAMMKVAVNHGIYNLQEIKAKYNEYAMGGAPGADPMAGGGGIHIKPSHRGRLTELKKRTGKTEAELYNDGNPAHKKMVVFARNSRKWKHGDGGLLFNLFYPGGNLTPEEQIFEDFVVKTSEDPMVDIAKQNPGYSTTLSKIYEDDAFNKQQASRLLEAYNYAGRPYLLTLPIGDNRAYTNREMLASWQKPVMFLNEDKEQGFDDLVAELSHPLQFKYGNNSNYLEHLNCFYSADDYKDKTRYDFPNKYESETHLDFKPLVKDYILKGILPGQIHYTNETEGFLGNDVIIENPTFEQVMDSARAYNQKNQDTNYQYKKKRYKRTPRDGFEKFFGDLF